MTKKPWAVFWKERPEDRYIQIARYQNRYLAEDHAAHLLSKVQGSVRVCWVSSEQVA